MDDALKVIKSLITTSSDGGLLVKEINEEYKEMVGKPIPLQEFGFSTLAEFLKSTNEFSGTKTANGIKVTIKIPGKSAHIIAMRQQQNVSQAEKKRRKKAMMRGGVGGAISSQQPRRPGSSQVMRRNIGTIMKQRPRVQSQRVGSFGSKPKSVPPPSMPRQPMNNANWPPMHKVTNQTMPSQKVSLHDRFVQKQVLDPTMQPALNSMRTAYAPQTPPTSPTEFRCKSPQTPPPPLEEPSSRSKLMARLAAKQTTSDNSRQNSNDSGSHTSSVGRMSRSDLLARLAPKQSTPSVSNSMGRSALQKICQNLESRLHMNQCNNAGDHKENAIEAVSSGKTTSRRDLYARLSPKVNESAASDAKTTGGDSLQTSSKPSINSTRSTLLNFVNKGTNLSSRLQPKQIDTVSSELQQINQQVRKIHFKKVF